MKGLTPHPTALHLVRVTDFSIFASVPATAVFSSASVFNFKDILAEEALLPDDNLKIMMILLVLLMLAIVENTDNYCWVLANYVLSYLSSLHFSKQLRSSKTGY